ncbi:MAG: aldo/keto reductase [Alphaproteobacteria bacterium]|nr:aldo/keto reductase [Alphaproteobacteria bacterium]MBV9421205.1 aldo/keto reductase [Alphaproteobacteria bacterium]MBV9539848.1 aldo/keto reductase [Alphaproteobacteria bacterium]
METTRLGNTGLKVSRICLGCMTYGSPNWRDWVLGEEESRPFIKRALEAGINFFDTADVYSVGRSEEIVGKALKDFAQRDKVVLATKVCGVMSDDVNDRGLSRKHIMSSIDNSLKRLQTDFVDLYQIHRFDPTTPIEETIEALHDVVKAGKARYIGASSMYAWQFSKYLHTQAKLAATKFVSMQNFYNLVYREEEREMLPLCRDQGIGVVPWSPLARGFLAGNRSREGDAQTTRAKSDANILTAQAFRESDYETRDRVNALAQEKRVTAAQIALAWLLHQPGVTAPIVGASKMKHLDDAIGAVSVKLSDDEVKGLAKGYQTRRIMGHA